MAACGCGFSSTWLDNNHAERALRGPVVGRKNHYGSRSKRGTDVAALFYTLCETAKLQDVDPRAYMLEAAYAGALVNRCVKKFRQQQPSTTPLPCLHLQIERPGEPLASAPVR